MAGYNTSNPPVCVRPGFNAAVSSEWEYSSVDAATVVRVSGYFTNAEDLGMKKGDVVRVYDNDASPLAMTIHIVSAINADGSADLSDAGATASTNTD